MYKKLRFVLVFFIFLPFFGHHLGFGSQTFLEINPGLINIGDTVTIKIRKANNHDKYRISILSPSGRFYNLIPEEKGEYYQISFTETYDKGFLKPDWNKYSVNLLNSNNKLIDNACFFLKDKNKNLFFTVYVDDIGSGGYLNSTGEKWFKKLGGKINYGFENGDRGTASLKNVIAKYKNREDYIFHHFHSIKYSKNRIFIRINNLLKWKQKKEFINNLLGIQLRDRHFILILGLLTSLMTGFWLWKRNKAVKIILIISLFISLAIFLAILPSQLVLNENNWSLRYSDIEWCKKFLLNSKRKFEENNLRYPQVIRHGWDLPPRGLNKFYLTQMGVIADASFIFPNSIKLKNYNVNSQNNKNNYEKDNRVILRQLGKYSYKWPEKVYLPIPYYTDVSGELNNPYDGVELNRGILEMPLAFSNICENGSYEVDYKIIDKLPEGALVSTYVHPSDDLRYLNEIISYLQENYNLNFVSALDYINIYLNYYPRPVLIDSKLKKAYWAYLQGDHVISISESNHVVFDNEKLIIKLINFGNLPPFIGLKSDTYSLGVLDKKYDFIGTNGESIRLYRLK